MNIAHKKCLLFSRDENLLAIIVNEYVESEIFDDFQDSKRTMIYFAS